MRKFLVVVLFREMIQPYCLQIQEWFSLRMSSWEMIKEISGVQCPLNDVFGQGGNIMTLRTLDIQHGIIHSLRC